jgi:hypothetical protein
MLLWVSLLAGLALAVAILALVVAMSRAERRARRSLLLTLGLPGDAVELLMCRNSDVLAELTLMRMSAASHAERAPADPPVPEPESASLPAHPTIRLVHPVAGEPRTPGETRRSSYPGRSQGL